MNLLLQYREQLLSGAAYTLIVSAITLLASTVLGIALVSVRATPLRAAQAAVSAYVEVFQNVPYLIVVMFFYFGLPEVGIRLSAGQSVVVGLSLYSAAYIAEALRGGVNAVPRNQLIAARSCGLNEVAILRSVLMPQALVYSLPSMTNQWIRVIKNSTVLAIIGGGDLLYQVNQLAAETYAVFTFYAFAAVAYWIIIIPVSRFGQHVELLFNWRRIQLGKARSIADARTERAGVR